MGEEMWGWCLKCGMALLPGDAQCYGCGWNVAKGGFLCPECGFPLDEGVCETCGWRQGIEFKRELGVADGGFEMPALRAGANVSRDAAGGEVESLRET